MVKLSLNNILSAGALSGIYSDPGAATLYGQHIEFSGRPSKQAHKVGKNGLMARMSSSARPDLPPSQPAAILNRANMHTSSQQCSSFLFLKTALKKHQSSHDIYVNEEPHGFL